LTYLSKLLLNIKREEIEPEKTFKYFLTKNQLIHLIQHTEFDSFLSSAIMFKIQLLPLTNQLTGFAGNLWSKTLCGSLVDRNEFLLLHAFHGKKFICPDKYDYKKRQNSMLFIFIDFINLFIYLFIYLFIFFFFFFFNFILY